MQEAFGFSMPIGEAMRTQRAIRRLKPDPVEDGLLLQLVELALKAPTGSNVQGWEFVVVKDPAVKRAIGRLHRQAWGFSSWLASKSAKIHEKRRRLRDAVEWQADHFEEIPVVMVACQRGRYLPVVHVLTATYFGSIFPAIQNLLLAARAANLGATLTTYSLWNSIALRRILGLPWNITPCAVIPLGWPIGRYGPTTRRPVREVVSFDRFGNRPAA